MSLLRKTGFFVAVLVLVGVLSAGHVFAEEIFNIEKIMQSAKDGDPVSQAALGAAYLKGRGVPVDYAEAVRWYRASAEQGDRRGQTGLGFMYFFGQGVVQDYTEAAVLFRKAADQEDPMAQAALGISCKYGWGVPTDKVTALMWFVLGAKMYKVSADERDALVQELSRTQIDEAYRRADEWRPIRP